MPAANYPDLAPVEDLEISGLLANVTIDPAYTHAQIEHPDTFEIVRDCFSKKGAYIQFQVEAKKRYLRVCIIDEAAGLIGFQIVDVVNKVAKERTCYIKESIKNLKQLLDYARRMRYPRFNGPL